MDFRNDNNDNSGYDNDLDNTFYDDNHYNNNNQFNNSNYNNENGFNNNNFNYNNENPYNQAPNNSNGYAIASLVLGILSIPFGCCYGLGIIFSIISIIFGVVSRKSNNGKLPGMSLAGIICSILGIICSLFIIFSIVIALSTYDFTNMDINEIINSIEGSSNNSFY